MFTKKSVADELASSSEASPFLMHLVGNSPGLMLTLDSGLSSGGSKRAHGSRHEVLEDFVRCFASLASVGCETWDLCGI